MQHAAALLAGVHFWIAGFVVVHGGGGCCDQGGIDQGPCLQEQAALSKQVVDHSQDLL